MVLWRKGNWGLGMVVLLGGCAGQMVETQVDMPVVVVECPDPSERKRLGEGDTYRDLARAHAQAVNGWERCFDAAEINGQ